MYRQFVSIAELKKEFKLSIEESKYIVSSIFAPICNFSFIPFSLPPKSILTIFVLCSLINPLVYSTLVLNFTII